MFTDKELRVCDSVDVSASDPDFSSSIDLGDSPDMGSGNQLMAVINFEAYTANGSTVTTIDIVTSSVAALSTTPRVLGTIAIPDAEIDARILAGNTRQPIVLRINPDQFSGTDVGGVAERFLGLRFSFTTATPTTLTCTATFVECFQSDPTHGHHTTGMKVL